MKRSCSHLDLPELLSAGIGIGQAARERIFLPFEQEGHAVSRGCCRARSLVFRSCKQLPC